MSAPMPIPVPAEESKDPDPLKAIDDWVDVDEALIQTTAEYEAWVDETKLKKQMEAFNAYWSGKEDRKQRITIELERIRERDQELDKLMGETVKQLQWWFRYMAQQDQVAAMQHGIVEMSQCLMGAINSWQDKDAGKNMRNKLVRLLQEDKVFHETFLNVTKEMYEVASGV